MRHGPSWSSQGKHATDPRHRPDSRRRPDLGLTNRYGGLRRPPRHGFTHPGLNGLAGQGKRDRPDTGAVARALWSSVVTRYTYRPSRSRMRALRSCTGALGTSSPRWRRSTLAIIRCTPEGRGSPTRDDATALTARGRPPVPRPCRHQSAVLGAIPELPRGRLRPSVSSPGPGPAFPHQFSGSACMSRIRPFRPVFHRSVDG